MGFEGGLAGRVSVGSDHGAGMLGDGARHIDDASPSSIEHGREQRETQRCDGHEVDRDRRRPLGWLDRDARTERPDDRSVVDKDVHRTKFVVCASHGSLKFVQLAEIRRGNERSSTEFEHPISCLVELVF